MQGFSPTTSSRMMAALVARPVSSSYSSSDITSMASGSCLNLTRLGMRRVLARLLACPKVVLLIGP